MQTLQCFYPFGSSMPGYSYKADSADGYRFGFNGAEREGNGFDEFYSFNIRIHNARLGRFLSVDPLSSYFASNGPYNFAENDVIRCVDLEGGEKIEVHKIKTASVNSPGYVVLNIVTDYQVITDGVGAVHGLSNAAKELASQNFVTIYARDFNYKNPSNINFLTTRQTKLAKNADIGSHPNSSERMKRRGIRSANKLLNRGINYTKIEVSATLNVCPSKSLAESLNWMVNDLDGRGIIYGQDLTVAAAEQAVIEALGNPNWRNPVGLTNFQRYLYFDMVQPYLEFINNVSILNYHLMHVETVNEAPASGAGLINGIIGDPSTAFKYRSTDMNLIVMANERDNDVDIIVHEYGHNATDQGHGPGYGYEDEGLSNIHPTLTVENVQQILENRNNINKIKVHE